jgi:hypothetical protein
LQPDPTLDLRVTLATGMTPVGNLDDRRSPGNDWQFYTGGEGRIEVKLASSGAGVPDAELIGVQLSGRMNETNGSVEFRLRGQLRAQKAGAPREMAGMSTW